MEVENVKLFSFFNETKCLHRRSQMRKLNRWAFVVFLLVFILGCNPLQEIIEARESAE